ncbi:hypothetical protein NVP1046O_23 [Vibrio phage 1.046.O._10N.286.52.E3]|nr:hypothetical protein NVP1046O_23 [Vibrio phage 1.046.O._10N.286.52.E3]
MSRTYEIASVELLDGKYARFVTVDEHVFTGKYGYFSYIANNLIGGVTFPVKVRIDSLGESYFHVEAVFDGSVWVKPLCRRV